MCLPESSHSVFYSQSERTIRFRDTVPSKNELARSCKICARILHARLAWHVHAICPFSCKILAQSCTYLARNGARFCKSCCKNNYLHFLQDLARNGARLCKNRARKGTYCVHVPSKSCMQDSCKILASSFLLGGRLRDGTNIPAFTMSLIASLYLFFHFSGTV